MSEMAPETSVVETPSEAPADVSPEATPVADAPVADAPAGDIKTNPAWQPVLDVLPTSLHEVVAPTLKEWDRGVNERFREIHGQYESYKPYEELIQAGIPVEDISAAVGFMQRLTSDPKAVYDAMTEYYKFGIDPAAAQVDPMSAVDPEHDPYTDPTTEKVTVLEQQIKDLQAQVQQEQQQKEMAAQDQALESALGELEKTYGPYDREYVLTQMAAGADAVAAVKSYQSLVEKIKTENNRPSAPTVVGGGSGGVVATPDVAKMSQPERTRYVAGLLKNRKENG